MEKSLNHRVGVVTGAGNGIGKSIACLFAEHGASVAVVDLDTEVVRRVVDEISSNGGEAMGIRVDVSQSNEVADMVEQVVGKYGTIDILVNSAGVLLPTKFTDISEEEWNWVMDINLTGTFLCIKHVVPVMRGNKYGRIVNISSSAGKSVSTLGGAHYTTSKAGVLGLTRHVAKELASAGINVNAVCPGLIATEMVLNNCSSKLLRKYEDSFPISRLGTPEEVGRLVLFLSTDDSAYITGASFDINGGDLMI